MSEQTKDSAEIGALWEKTSARGTYFTGKIGDQPVVVFRNDRKAAGSKAPDWRVLKPTPRADREVDQRVPETAHHAIDDQDIPF